MVSRQTLAALRRHIWTLLLLAGAEPPVTDAQLEKVANLQGSVVKESPSLTSLHGCLSATSEGLVIRVNPQLTPNERRFAIAHEIGHTLIDHDIPLLRSKLRAKLERPLTKSHSVKEQLCDWIAAELLIPQPILAADMTSCGSAGLAVERLASEFGTVETGLYLQLEMGGYIQRQFAW